MINIRTKYQKFISLVTGIMLVVQSLAPGFVAISQTYAQDATESSQAIVEPTTTPSLTPTSMQTITVTPTEMVTPIETGEILDGASTEFKPELVEREEIGEKTITDSTNEEWNIDDGLNIAETKESVKLGIRYHFPHKSEVSVVFTSLPKDESLRSPLKIRQITIKDLNLPPEIATTEEFAYDITTGMQDGIYTYSVELPKSSNDSKAEIAYVEKSAEEVLNTTETLKTEEVKPIEEANIEQLDSSVKAKDIDHMTIFFVTSGQDQTNLLDIEILDASNTELNSNDENRYETNGHWPKYWNFDFQKDQFLEFHFSPNVSSNAIITGATITFEYQRDGLQNVSNQRQAIRAWDGSDFNRTIADTTTLRLASANTDETKTITIPLDLVNTPDKVNNFKFRFFMKAGGLFESWKKTRHDYVAINISYVLPAPVNGLPHNQFEPTNEFDFTWDPVTDDTRPVTYDFQSSLNPLAVDGVLTTALWHSPSPLTTPMIHSTGAPDGKWYWQVRTVNSDGIPGPWSEIWNVTLDTVAPTAPTNLRFTNPNLSCGSTTNSYTITPTWDASIDTNFLRYDYESYNPPSGTYIWPTTVTNPRYSGAFTRGEGLYGYRVRAVDQAGHVSDWTATQFSESCQVTYRINPTVTLDESFAHIIDGVACADGNAWPDDGLKAVVEHWNPAYRLEARVKSGGGGFGGWFELTEGLWGSGHRDIVDSTLTYTLMHTGQAAVGPAEWQVRVLDDVGNAFIPPTEDNMSYTITGDLTSDACGNQIIKSNVTVCKKDPSGAGLPNWRVTLKGAKIGSTISVPSNGTASNAVTLDPGNYAVFASGTYNYGDSRMIADAANSFRYKGLPCSQSYDSWVNGDGASCMNHYLNVNPNITGSPTTAGWGTTYNPAHVYAQGFTGGNLTYKIWDGCSTSGEGCYGDNEGSLSLDVYQGFVGDTGTNGCITFTDVPYGDYQLEEILQEGWTKTSGEGIVTINTPTESFDLVNTVIPTTLTLQKIVDNKGVGTASPSAWFLGITGVTSGRGPTVGPITVNPGTDYIISESGGPNGYTASPWTCDNGITPQNNPTNATVSLPIGKNITCTITNTVNTGSLKVQKIVNVADNLADWEFKLDNGPWIHASDSGLVDFGTVITGNHTITEKTQTGYYLHDVTGCTPITSNNNSATANIDTNQSTTCVFTNYAIPVYTGTNSCPTNAPVKKLINSYSISATDADGQTLDGLPAGNYLFEPSGTFIPTSASGYVSDAAYTTINSSLSTQYGINGVAPDYGAHALLANLGSGVGIVNWGSYRPDHMYSVYTSSPANPQFVIGDRFSTWYGTPYDNQGGMSDNSGSVTLNVYECHNYGTISGQKIEDLDGDGTVDSGEPALSGWDISLYNETGNGFIASTSTDINGDYTFADVSAGNYQVCETNKPGWFVTQPGGGTVAQSCASISVTAGQNTDYDFANFKLGSIQGRKYNDTNANGDYDTSELYLDGWNIRLYDTNWNLITQMETGDDTTPAGNVALGQYRFVNLAKGNYYTCEVLKDGWTQTDPGNTEAFANQSGANDEATRCRRTTISQSGQTTTGKSFGNVQYGKVIVTKFNDENNNGIKDTNENNIPNWDMTLSGYGSLPTDVNGIATFSSVLAGTYTVGEIQDPLWKQTVISCSQENPNITPTPTEIPTIGLRFIESINAQEATDTAEIILKAGETWNCIIGNHESPPQLLLSKENNALGDMTGGSSVVYTIKLKVLDNSAYGVKVTDLLPQGIKYRAGSWTATKNGSVFTVGEPTYASPGTWTLNDLSEGDEVTLSLTADISADQKPGTYKDLALAYGCQLNNTCGLEDENTLLAQAVIPGIVNDNYVGTEVTVVKNEQNNISTNIVREETKTDSGSVLGASTGLPATGADIRYLYIAILSIIAGSGLLLATKRRYHA